MCKLFSEANKIFTDNLIRKLHFMAIIRMIIRKHIQMQMMFIIEVGEVDLVE